MFTGIIESIGRVLSNAKTHKTQRMVVAANLSQLVVGESIAVNGVCLTLLPSQEGQLSFDLSPETIKCTTLGSLQAGTAVNLERAMCAAARFGGHYVSGHVDAMVQIQQVKQVGECKEIILSGFSTESRLYLVPKGSITLEGVSLTINQVDEQRSVYCMLVPHTLQHTTLAALHPRQIVNIEFDYLTRIIAHQLQLMNNV